MKSKRCCRCKLTLSLDNFKSNSKNSDGKQGQCIGCQKIYRKEHYERNRDKYIEKAKVWNSNFLLWWKDYKKQFSCSRCSENHPACIQFHHTKKNKDLTVSRLVMIGDKKRIEKEIKKCIPLCANCHAKEHLGEYFPLT